MNAFIFARALGVLALAAFPATAHASVDAASQRIIKQSGVALGMVSARGVRTIRIDQNVSAVGLSGTQTQWFDLSTGRFAEYSVLPPLTQDDGYDGRVAWNRDGAGVVWNEGSDAGRSSEIT